MTTVTTELGAEVTLCLQSLESDGLARLPNLLNAEQLRSMQTAFATRLKHLRFNDIDGYECTEPLRHMVQDVLMLDQGFVDLALHPLVKDILDIYIGDDFSLCEAKGWLSLATRKNFHGWHGDAWYDQTQIDWIPREVKLAIYLTDVKSGAFHYVRGSHRKLRPRTVRQEELADVPEEDVIQMLGPAGTAFLFDTSGVHRQGMPILEPRQAVFLNYHQPSIPLQQEDVEYYRYHPLILNAAFLGNLSERDMRILGFGDKSNYRPAFIRQGKFALSENLLRHSFHARIQLDSFLQKWTPRFKRLLGMKRR